jgi:hypothetical protein
MNKRALDGLMASLEPDADFIDEAGKTTPGHDALQARFCMFANAVLGLVPAASSV